MVRRLLIVITILLFISQIAFSIYYSGEIISQNSEFETNSDQLKKTNLIHQQLIYQLSLLTSVSRLSSTIPANFQPIKQILDLSHE